MSESDDFFGGSSKSASFAGQPGIAWGGVIDRIGSKVQKREYSPNGELGALKFYPGSQDPIWQLPVTILTDVRDPAVPNDDGRRTIYFEGAKRAALKEALRAAGHRGGPVLGDWMALQFYATEQGKGAEPKKLFRAQYVVNPNPAARGVGYVAPDAEPVQTQAGEFFQGGQQQAQQAAMNQPFQAANPATAPQWAQPAAPVVTAPVVTPFAPAASTAAPANNWPPAGSIPAPAASAAQGNFHAPGDVHASQDVGYPPADQPVAAGAGGPVALERPWG